MFLFLLEQGLNPAAINNYGSTPLHFACREGLQFGVEKLVEVASATINEHSLIYGTPLYIAAAEDFPSVVQTILDAGAAIDETGGGTLLGSALMAACANDNAEIVKFLLSRGASREIEGSRFLSAAGTARAFRKENILKILEEYPHEMDEIKSKST